MRIGVVATRLAGVDGVTFEATKWEINLERMGHDVRLCAGEVDALRYDSRLVPAMHFTYPPAARVTAAAFDRESEPKAVRHEIERLASQLLPVLEDWVSITGLEMLIVENAWAVPMQLPLGVALRRLVEDTGLPTIGHHHDYWWERERFAGCIVPDILELAFPPDLPNVRHVSISSMGAAGLKNKRGLFSEVVPNVFDFEQQRPHRSLVVRGQIRREIGMPDGGILVVQPTRVVPRKGIELAIELVARLEDPDATLLVTSPAGDEGLDYLVSLEQQATRLGVRLRYAADRFAPDHEGVMLAPAHSLSDAYQAADLITYPSLYEGFGNALVEAVFYGVPIVVNRYPVYDSDIRPLGMHFIEVQGAITEDTVAEVRRYLRDPRLRSDSARHNFNIAKQHLGYRLLRRRLAGLINNLVPGRA